MALSSLPVFDPANQNDLSRSRATQNLTDGKSGNQPDLSQRSAWLREMERSQVSSWFKPFVDRVEAQTSAPPWNARQFVPGLTTLAPHVPTHLGTVQTDNPVATPSSTSNESVGHLEGDSTAALAGHLADTLKIRVDSGRGHGDAIASEFLPSRHTDHELLRLKLTSLQQTAWQTTTAPDDLSDLFALDTGLDSSLEPSVTSPYSGSAARAGTTTGVDTGRPLNGSLSESNAVIRLHAQWNADTANLWLGMDGTAAQIASQAAIIVPELHRYFNAQGMRLGKVVCNGQIIFDPAESALPEATTSFTHFLPPHAPPQEPDERLQNASPWSNAGPSPAPRFLPPAYPQEVS